MKPKVIVVLGPTATGKSDLAVTLAKKFNGEVISADSRQVYKGLDIGSGKITKKEMCGIPHHLLDAIEPKKQYSVEAFKKAGQKAIQDIVNRGKVPIICGGTGFYIDALIFNTELPNVPPDKKLRAQLEKQSVKSLFKKLQKLDPKRAENIDPHNKIRLIRAIEIAKALGSVPKVKQESPYKTLFIGLTLERTALRKKIHTRLLKRMERNKMVNEVKRLRVRGMSWKRLHTLGLEYRYIALYLQNKLSKSDMLVKLESEINHFTKRQMTWFKRNKAISWFNPRDLRQIKAKVAQFLG